MLIENKTFAGCYSDLIKIFQDFPLRHKIHTRGYSISHEFMNVQIRFDVKANDISIYSSVDSRAIPISFVLAEWLWINSADESLSNIAKFNSSMAHFSDDGVILNGAYGPRIFPLI